MVWLRDLDAEYERKAKAKKPAPGPAGSFDKAFSFDEDDLD